MVAATILSLSPAFSRAGDHRMIEAYAELLSGSITLYTNGDVVGQLIEIDLPSMIGEIRNLSVATEKINVFSAFTAYFFNALPTDPGDNAPFAPSYADAQSFIHSAQWTVNNPGGGTVDIGSSTDDIHAFVAPLKKLYCFLVATAGAATPNNGQKINLTMNFTCW